MFRLANRALSSLPQSFIPETQSRNITKSCVYKVRQKVAEKDVYSYVDQAQITVGPVESKLIEKKFVLFSVHN